MKEVNIYIRGINKSKEDNRGYYCGLLEYKGKEKIVYGKGFNTTAHRMILMGILHSLRMLKEPCKLNLHTTCKVGFVKPINKCIHKDLIGKVKESIESNGHELKEIITQDRQTELAKIIRNINRGDKQNI